MPGRSLPPVKTRYPLYRRLGGPQGWSGQVRKISPPAGFDPRPFQPVASRYTVYATRLTILFNTRYKLHAFRGVKNDGGNVLSKHVSEDFETIIYLRREVSHTSVIIYVRGLMF
jgi:hypothetical protein